MSGEIYMAAVGALAYEKRLEIISNNLANANTVGYKQDHGHFQIPDTSTLSVESIQDIEKLDASQAEFFWCNFNVYTDFSSGSFKNTGNDFDLAINGNGFFCIQTDNGVQYTRKGDFTLNGDGILVTRNGLAVLGESGEISIDSNGDPNIQKKFSVDEGGYIYVDGKQIDKLRIVDFPQPYNFNKVGGTLFEPADSGISQIPVEKITVSQGFIELSNVEGVKMMTEMIEVLRGYETYQKIIRSVDEINSTAINKIADT